MLYSTLKLIHILSAAFLTMGMVAAGIYWFKLKDPTERRLIIQKQTGLFILPTLFLQLMTGFTLLNLKQFDYSLFWIKGSIMGFVGFMVAWFGFIYLVMSSRFRFAEGLFLTIASLNLLSLIYFMASQ